MFREKGAPVVLMHGFPDSGAIWDRQVETLIANGYHTIVPDLPGCGDSGIPINCRVTASRTFRRR